MSEEVLAVRDLRIEFPELFRTVKAVRGADLSVRRGEIMGLVGESGCGKSTVALSLLHLIEHDGGRSGSKAPTSISSRGARSRHSDAISASYSRTPTRP